MLCLLIKKCVGLYKGKRQYFSTNQTFRCNKQIYQYLSQNLSMWEMGINLRNRLQFFLKEIRTILRLRLHIRRSQSFLGIGIGLALLQKRIRAATLSRKPTIVFPFNIRELLVPQRRLYLHLKIIQYSVLNLIHPYFYQIYLNICLMYPTFQKETEEEYLHPKVTS